MSIDEYKGKSGLGEYGDFVLMANDMIENVLDAIKKTGEEDNTIVVFTSDNGCSPAAGIRERHNIAFEHPEIVKELKSLMLRYVDRGRSTSGKPQKNDVNGAWKQLENLRKLEL